MNRTLGIFYRIGLTIHVLKTALSAGLSWLVASWISHNQYPYFASLGAVLTVHLTVADSINKATHRVAGIIGGVIVSIVAGQWLPINWWSITLVVLIGLAFSTALRLNSQIVSQVAVSSLLVLSFGRSPGYAVDRITETIIGSAIAIILNVILIPPNPIPDAEKRVLYLGEYACTVLNNLAIAFREQALRPVDMPYVQELVDETEKSYKAVQLAGESLRYSPFLRIKRSRVLALEVLLRKYELITIQIRGIARALVDWGPEDEPNPCLIDAMTITAKCVGLMVQHEICDSDELGKKLQASLEEAQALQRKCLRSLRNLESLELLRDVGSILSDLSRILDEVSGESRYVTHREPHLS